MVVLLATANAFSWTYIHGWYFGVQSIEWINILGVYAHSSVIA